MKKRSTKIINIDDKTLKALNLYKKYDRALKQAIIDKEDLNSPKIKLISDRFNRLVEYLDNYVLYNNTKLE